MTSIAARIMDANYCDCEVCKKFKDDLVQHIFKTHGGQFHDEMVEMIVHD